MQTDDQREGTVEAEHEASAFHSGHSPRAAAREPADQPLRTARQSSAPRDLWARIRPGRGRVCPKRCTATPSCSRAFGLARDRGKHMDLDTLRRERPGHDVEYVPIPPQPVSGGIS